MQYISFAIAAIAAKGPLLIGNRETRSVLSCPMPLIQWPFHDDGCIGLAVAHLYRLGADMRKATALIQTDRSRLLLINTQCGTLELPGLGKGLQQGIHQSVSDTPAPVRRSDIS